MIETDRVSAYDIADRMGISVRTVYRKINDLRKAGYNIQSRGHSKFAYYFVKNVREGE